MVSVCSTGEWMVSVCSTGEWMVSVCSTGEWMVSVCSTGEWMVSVCSTGEWMVSVSREEEREPASGVDSGPSEEGKEERREEEAAEKALAVEPKGDPTMAGTYLRQLLPTFTKVYQGTMLPSVRSVMTPSRRSTRARCCPQSGQ